jgi:hypothetical protein
MVLSTVVFTLMLEANVSALEKGAEKVVDKVLFDQRNAPQNRCTFRSAFTECNYAVK